MSLQGNENYYCNNSGTDFFFKKSAYTIENETVRMKNPQKMLAMKLVFQYICNELLNGYFLKI